MINQLRVTLTELPWALPGLMVAMALGWMVSRPRAQQGRPTRIGIFLLVVWFVLMLVVTLSPSRSGYIWIQHMQPCALGDWTPLPPLTWFTPGSRSMNVWLFMPGGLGAALLAIRRQRALAAAVVLLAPIIVEAAQHYMPFVVRSCSSQDLIDNWTGAATGLALGLAVLWTVRTVAPRPRARSPRQGRAVPRPRPDPDDRPPAPTHGASDSGRNLTSATSRPPDPLIEGGPVPERDRPGVPPVRGA